MKYIVINTKQYFDKDKFSKFILDFNNKFNEKKIILACDIVHYNLIKDKSIILCLQSFDDFTNKIKVNYNVKYSLVGHKDDRINKKETDQLINKKIKEILNNNIVPILCIGEEIYEENIEKTLSTIYVQIEECLKDLSAKSVEKIFIAYEPFWAISNGKPYVEIDFCRIKTIIQAINKKIKEKYFINPIILYGGSINENNVMEINNLEIDGFLIGAASTNKEVLNKILYSIT